MTVTYTHQAQQARWPSPADPGDLSRRVARRRAELGLSQEQLAARSRMSPRYLEYLERYPARPSATTLRDLAAALQTTPAALLGGGGDTPPVRARLAGPPVAEKLIPGQCRRLIKPGGVGRFTFVTSTGPVVLPVNYALVAGTIVVRTAKGTVIDGHGDSPIAFEVDHIDHALGQVWSVLVRGQAHHVRHPAELSRVREDAIAWPWPGGESDVYLRIVPDLLTGHRICSR
jgi:transcriptional regulator with XRE-family HTH domain